MASERLCTACDARTANHLDCHEDHHEPCCGQRPCCSEGRLFRGVRWTIAPLPPAGLDTTATQAVLDDVLAERDRQHAKWGQQDLPDGTTRDHAAVLRAVDAQTRCAEAALLGTLAFRHILEEELCEAMAETDDERLEVELVQVAAVAVQWVEAIRRRRAKADAAVRAQLGGG